ncbi:MAG: hypothetical protein J6C76_00775 [Oscillospiraceae bacterium]|nr:hypothetical protein [Oscillospiraceae bacterium]MBP1570414.1 hypothetical protein [Oscillospiraceae bacterium]
MSNNISKISPETQKFLDEIKDNFIDTTHLKKLIEEQNTDMKVAYQESPKSKRGKFDEWIQFAPAYVVFLCKILKVVLDIGGFVYMLIGGFLTLFFVWQVLKAVHINGWSGLLNKSMIYIIIYLISIFIINKLRFIMYRIVNRI